MMTTQILGFILFGGLIFFIGVLVGAYLEQTRLDHKNTKPAQWEPSGKLPIDILTPNEQRQIYDACYADPVKKETEEAKDDADS